jgi:hypothetical protein
MHREADPDVAWVSHLCGRPPADSERAVQEAQGERRLFRHLAREHAREGRESYIEIDAPLELHALVRLGQPAHVVEVGVSSGVSSAYILSALEKNRKGTLHSVDLPSHPRRSRSRNGPPRMSWSLPAGRATGWAVPFPLRKRWDLRLGDKADVLPLLAEELPAIDLLVYDVPHEDRTTREELRTLDPLLSEGAVVLIDHGPGGDLCAALRDWSQTVGSEPIGRANLGLYGARRNNAPNGERSAVDHRHALRVRSRAA